MSHRKFIAVRVSSLVLALCFSVSGAKAQIGNVQILGTTPTQVALSYLAPSGAGACTVAVSESAGLSPVVNDVDTSKFSGANSDNRFSFLNQGQQRYFVVGTIPKTNGLIANQAQDGSYYGRALKPNTKHYFQITCGSNTANGTFTTPNLPLGKTYGEPPPVAGPGVYAFPSMYTSAQWALSNPRTFEMRDPTTGIPVHFLDVPGEYTADFTNSGNGYTLNSTAGGILGTWMTVNAGGSGYAVGDTFNITGGSGSGGTGRVQAVSGGAVTQAWLYGAGSGYSVTTGAATSAITGAGSGLTVNIPAVSTCANWTTPGNLLGSAGFATYSGTTQDKCPAMSTTLAEANGTQYTTDALQVSFTASGSVNGDVLDACITVNGSTCWGGTVQTTLTTTATAYCLPNEAACHSTANRPNPGNDGWSIPPVLAVANGYSATMLPNALAVQNPSGTAGNGNFGWLFWKDSTSTADTISIQNVRFSHYTSLAPAWYDSGIEWVCGSVAVNDSNSMPGYLCQLPTRSGLFILWVRTDVGEARFLGKGVLSPGQIPNFTSQTGFGIDTSTFDQSTGTAMYFAKLDNQTPTHHTHVLKCTLPASGNSYYSTSQPANTQACNGSTTGTWSDLTPGPNYLDVLINNFDSNYSYATFPALGQNGTQSHYLLWSALAGLQNSPAWVGAFDLNTNSVIAAMPMYNRQAGAGYSGATNMNWCGYHTSHSPGNTTWWHWGDHTVYPSATGVPASMTTTTLTASIPAGSPNDSISVSFAGVPTLIPAGIAVNDWIQIDNEGFQVTSVDGSNNYHLLRGQTIGGSFPASSPTHANGSTVYMFCDNGTYGNGTPGQDWWNFVADPHGNNVQLIQDGIANHDSYAYNPATGMGNGVSESGSWSACYNYAPGTNCPTKTSGCSARGSSTCSYIVTNSPAFAGVTKNAGGNAYTKHPTASQQINGSDQSWGLDVTPIQGDATANPKTNGSGNTLTAVTGSLFYFTPDTSYDLKHLATLCVTGWRPCLDVSGPSSSIGGTSADNYKYCYVYKAGECYAGSTAGNVYINAPYLVVGPATTSGSHCFDGNSYMLPGFPSFTESELCFTNNGGFTNQLAQFAITPADSVGANTRALSWVWTGYGMNSLFANGHPTPDGKWILAFAVMQDGRPALFMIQQPPFPTSSTARNAFIQQTISISNPPANTANALVEFGYDSNLYCTSRADVCIANSSTYNQATPFQYTAGDSSTGLLSGISGVPCSSSCSIVVPVLPTHIAFYDVVYRDASNNVISRSTMNLTMDSINASPSGGCGVSTSGKVTFSGSAGICV